MNKEKSVAPKMRYTDEELSLIKNTFSENEEMLKVIRKVFLQIPLDVIDQQIIASIKGNKNLIAVIRKAFLPTIDAKAPLNQVIDMWMTLKMEGKTPEMVSIDARAFDKLIKYLDEQLLRLEGKEEIGYVSFSDLEVIKGKVAEDIYIDLMVRNTIIKTTEMQLNMFLLLAGMKEETVEETVKRLQKDSSK